MEKKKYLNEEWRPIKGYEGLYEVSNFGRVKSLGKGKTWKGEKILKLCTNYGGYSLAHLCKEGTRKHYTVHRLVATSFIPNPDNLPCINHKDCNPLNNCVWNLEWCDYKYNNSYGDAQRKRIENRTGLTAPKPVNQYSLTGEFIKEWPSASQVEKNLGYFKQIIRSCCIGKYRQAYGYVWRFSV